MTRLPVTRWTALAGLAVASACSGSTPAMDTMAPAVAPAADASVDAAVAEQPEQPAPQEEQLAAIQHAMNELDEGAQLCWAAAAAVDGYELAGEVAFTIDIPRFNKPYDKPGEPGVQVVFATPFPTVTVARDNTKAPRLLSCMHELLARYFWAPPLRGQTIQLPFKFRAPDGQSVIDRRLVPFVAQGKIAVAVLLDEQNSGNPHVSMMEVAIEAGATTELRVASRTEAWVFLGEALVTDGRGTRTKLSTGDMMLVPAEGLRQITAGAAPLRAVVVMTPGGEEGSARMGALPTPFPPTSAAARQKAPQPIIVRSADAQPFKRPGGGGALVLDPARTRRGELSAAMLRLEAGAAVPLHQHADETELLYILEGAGTMTVGGVALQVQPTSVVQVPPGAQHSFTASAALSAIQLYTPAGPEQRFKAPPPSPAPAR
jgi:quercetin dioxygenase-like cupin family protein